jgi:hypothetical protein
MKTYKIKPNFRFGIIFCIFLLSGINQQAIAQSTAAKTKTPAVLPGKGLAQFDFFYAGEAKNRNMYIVRDGKIVWSYLDSLGRGEISDAVLMTNGNILFAHQYAITLITPDKKVVWALRSQTAPANLGPSTTIQLLNEPRISENVTFGEFK